MQSNLLRPSLVDAHRRGRSKTLSAVMAAACLFAAGSACAVEVPVPNGDFSVRTNFGSIGGGVFNSSQTEVPLGTGPWLATEWGALGFIAPPEMKISENGASITGFASYNLLGVVSNGGYFSQTLPISYQVGKRYTVTVVFDAGGLINAGILGGRALGVALRDGPAGRTLLSTADGFPGLVTLGGLGGNRYELKLRYDVTGPLDGNVNIQLLGTPKGAISASLASGVFYKKVSLDISDIETLAGSVTVMDGNTQSTVVDNWFGKSLKVKVLGPDGEPARGVPVQFASPASGASATLSTTQTSTDENGMASIDAKANTVAGHYVVSARVGANGPMALFSLNNLADRVATIKAFGVGSIQSARIGSDFPLPLMVKTLDAYGNPASDVRVTYEVPSTGATAALSAYSVVTDANGTASVTATALTQAGSYQVTARADGVDDATQFQLTNTRNDALIIDTTSGSQQKGATNGAFRCALEVEIVRQDGTPAAGLPVIFTAPSAGASAMLSDGSRTSMTLRMSTDAHGKARVKAIGNDVEGDYTVRADVVAGDDQYPPILFKMSNVGSLLFADGFDSQCSPNQ